MNTKERRTPASSRKPVRKRRRANSDIVYTPAQRFDKFRFLLRLVTVVAVVLALTLGMAIFFKVEVINVGGMEKYTPWDVREASGIQDGENLLTLNKAKAGGNIRAQLPYVDTVKIGIKLPDTVNIEITELTVVYAISDDTEGWWLMNASGTVVEQIDAARAETYTKVLGVQIVDPVVGQRATAAEEEEPTEETQDTAEETVEGETEPTTQLILKEEPVTVFARMEGLSLNVGFHTFEHVPLLILLQGTGYLIIGFVVYKTRKRIAPKDGLLESAE